MANFGLHLYLKQTNPKPNRIPWKARKRLKNRNLPKKAKNEFKAKTNSTENPKHSRIDGSRFGIGKLNLLRKRNFPKTAKTATSRPKRRNLPKKGRAYAAKLRSSSGNAETHQLSKFQVILIPSPGFGFTWFVSNPTPPNNLMPVDLTHHSPQVGENSSSNLSRYHHQRSRHGKESNA